jgi:hypothetical protein
MNHRVNQVICFYSFKLLWGVVHAPMHAHYSHIGTPLLANAEKKDGPLLVGDRNWEPKFLEEKLHGSRA